MGSPLKDPATVYVAIAAARHTQPNIGQQARVIIVAVAASVRTPRLTQRGRAGSSCCTQCWLRARCAWWRPTSTGRSFPCLLYTSDAADDLTRVDLGGRRIIIKT